MKKILNYLLFFTVLCGACQTAPPSYLPRSLGQKYFAACGNEGSLSFKLFRDSEYYVSGYIDWHERRGLHLSNVMGSTVAVLKKNTAAEIQLPNMVVALSVDDVGRIFVDRQFIGIYLKELYCVLSGRIPGQWYRDLAVSRGNDYLVKANDRERQVAVWVDFRRFQISIARRFLWLFTFAELTIGSYAAETGYLTAQGFRLNWQKAH